MLPRSPSENRAKRSGRVKFSKLKYVQNKEGELVVLDRNGELVLVHEGRLTATSVAAGPAFEGARIAAGMRAVPGAIDKVVLDGSQPLEAPRLA